MRSIKTPEEMAEEYANDVGEITDDWKALAAKDFLAGYKAAQEQLDTVIASRDAWKEDAERYAENADYWKVQAAAPQWISVKDRLPEPLQACVGYRKIMGTVSIVHISSSGKWMFKYEPEYASGITHWMPLPDMPKEEE